MNLQEIKSAVESGKIVHWKTDSYNVIKDRKGQWLIHCILNNYYIGLTWLDGKTMNGDARDFFIGE